ncbi:MAG: PEP-CTERM sorting domain-containing protein [Phycisphaeraceae bacterium]|nr:PEP-CTERM sorting domain-containing protein [Phycisphaeraceae bacterium]
MKFYAATAVALATLFCAASARANLAPQYTLTYNAADGSLTLDPLGDSLYTYVIVSTGALGGNDGFLEANHLLIPASAAGTFTTSDDEISQTDFNGWFGLGPQNLGNVLPAGLSQQQFIASIDNENTEYVRQPGQGLDPPNPDFKYRLDFVYNVPEPSSILLLGIGTALLAQRRRRPH